MAVRTTFSALLKGKALLRNAYHIRAVHVSASVVFMSRCVCGGSREGLKSRNMVVDSGRESLRSREGQDGKVGSEQNWARLFTLGRLDSANFASHPPRLGNTVGECEAAGSQRSALSSPFPSASTLGTVCVLIPAFLISSSCLSSSPFRDAGPGPSEIT